MDKKTISQPLYKGRSLTACMTNSLQILRSAWWRIIKAACIPLVVGALGEAIFSVGFSALEPSLSGIVVGLLLMFVGSLGLFGLFYHWISLYKKNGEFIPLDFKVSIKPVSKQALRFLVVHVPTAIFMLILTYIGVYGCLSSFIPVPYSIPLWVGILCFVVLIYVSMPLAVFCLDYLVGRASYYTAFVKGFTLGTRRWGAFFALVFLVTVIYGIVSIIIGLPLEVSYIIELMNRVSMNEGNAYALPGFFPIVKFILTAVVSFITSVGFLYPLLSIILLYTSYETLQKERKAFEKRQKENE